MKSRWSSWRNNLTYLKILLELFLKKWKNPWKYWLRNPEFFSEFLVHFLNEFSKTFWYNPWINFWSNSWRKSEDLPAKTSHIMQGILSREERGRFLIWNLRMNFWNNYWNLQRKLWIPGGFCMEIRERISNKIY